MTVRRRSHRRSRRSSRASRRVPRRARRVSKKKGRSKKRLKGGGESQRTSAEEAAECIKKLRQYAEERGETLAEPLYVAKPPGEDETVFLSERLNRPTLRTALKI